MKKNLLVLTLISSMIFGASPNPVFGGNGMVVSTSRQASEAGIEIMKKGGNAVDAACAVGFVLAVTSSSNGNIGGGGFMVARMADGSTFTQDHREMAPALSHRDMYLDADGNVIENMSLNTRAATGVPGTVDGLLNAWADYGSGNISRRELLAPAIALAEKGFELSRFEATRFNKYKNLFLKNKAATAIFLRKDGRTWEEGDRFIQKDLARTLKRIVREGRDGFYTGKTADLIVKEMKNGNGLITHDDLQNYRSVYRKPVTGSFFGNDIISMGPPSSGGALLIHMLNMLEHYPIDTLGWNSSDYIHILTEVERRAYADRAEHMGDSDYWDVPVQMFLSAEYAEQRISDISLTTASTSSDVYAGPPTQSESRETTHYSVVDKEGNAVSVTTTINWSYGGGYLVEGAGFFLNNEMDDFSSKPGTANIYGLIGNEANAIQPGKRPLSSMTPAIVLKDKKPFLLIGSPGGATIITTSMQTILNVVIHEMDIQAAVSANRVHSQWLPDILFYENNGLSKDVLKNLNQKGHVTKIHPWVEWGQANCIMINENGYYGGADSRGENTAIGY